MNFGANKTFVEVIREGAFAETYFGEIYSGLNEKRYKNSCKFYCIRVMN